MEDGDSDVEPDSLDVGVLDLDPVRVKEGLRVSDRVWDRLGEKEELGVSERLIERLIVRVSVGVAVKEGGIAMVPAKL